ncbi:MAG: glycoside hydrolase family 95 protein [Flavobacterium sp.]|uniref:glycoside hydrolase family 95 protein n=1 Tax=Flavobacterium sp. TaxID=239 RepID=UPI001B5A95F6|nr:glycoside hydrolase family 95 protein [Flavobacterium sp.]MBP6145972.1 glycoside hydrolase family 95 protein [Flavobacterium sp.]MBP7182355.1 glycoside hydrolase family 95 protein [Flavobacterium sp.]HRL70523.1 glycoside hydrolase family 95 protein [Flavobacterium sp.]
MMKISKNSLSIFILGFLFTTGVFAQNNKSLKLWYKQPAQKWSSEALPIGNGRMGAMFYGGVHQEKIQFNEQSLWSGDNNWDGEYETGDRGFGSYRNFGEITIDFAKAKEATAYSRSLDISNGIHQTAFIQNGIQYKRDAFASYPDQVLVFRYTATEKGAFCGKISLTSAQGAISKANQNSIHFEGVMANKLKYAAVLRIQHQGGKIKVEGNNISFENCNSLTLLLDARTNYKADFKSDWRGNDPLPLIEKELASAQSKSYKSLLKNHVADLSGLLGRASINIGTTDAAVLTLPTDERLKRYAGESVVTETKDGLKNKIQKGGEDPDLEEIMFQYGRYLLASSSRPGGLPANLQGLWNDSNTPAWASDYHNNINLQMNYWSAESTNLSECQLPLIDFIVAAQESCRIATRKAFGENTRGWTARTSQSIFGGNGWDWNIPASAWYAQHVYEHWSFTRDNDYLKQTAYPIIKEICQYWEDHLKKMPDGSLMVPNGWSPEHGPREDGVMMDQQLVWDLFQNYLEIAKVLNIDSVYQQKVAAMQLQLAPNKIGKWGQLQEWQEDRDDPDDEHRHTSHLFAVYPGRQISISITPELAQGAILSLRSRSGNYGRNENTPFTAESTVGDSRRSWTWPWRGALWARLGEGERAGIMLRGLLTYNTLPNLFCNHPPFQLDGNLGIPAAMAEMLLQSHTDVIHLLPAIPEKWAAKGTFSGLRARGGYEVDCSWSDGKVSDYKIYSSKPSTVKVRINDELKEINTIVK